MAPRANWKGFLKVGELTCPVALYTAASTSERVAFHTINRASGHRVRRQFVDRETGQPVEADAQVKGYEIGEGEYVMLEAEEMASALPASDKTLSVEAFIDCDGVDDVFLDRPYYLAPGDPIGGQAFAILREGMRVKKVAALAHAVLFRRVRSVLIRASDAGMVATTLHFNYEVRSAREAFAGLRETKIEGEMLDLAKHIIAGKTGAFDPASFDDRYEAALASLVKAKMEGRPVEVRKAPVATNVVDLMEALRKSAGAAGASSKSDAKKRSSRSGAGATDKAKADGPAKKAGSARRKPASGETRRSKAG